MERDEPDERGDIDYIIILKKPIKLYDYVPAGDFVDGDNRIWEKIEFVKSIKSV